MPRHARVLLAAAPFLALACGPTVYLEEGPQGSGASGSGASGLGGSGGVDVGGGGLGGGTGGAGNSGTGAGNTGSGAGTTGGKKEWAKAFGADGHQHLKALVVDPSGDITIAGSFAGDLDFGSGPLSASGSRSGFVARLSSKGKPRWALPFDADDCAATAVAVDESGTVAVTGLVKGSLRIGGAQVTGGDGIFLASLDAQGNLLWAKTFGSAGSLQADRGLGVAFRAGTIAMSGAFAGALDLGGGSLGGGGVFLGLYNAAGSFQWGTSRPGGHAVVGLAPSGRVFFGVSDTGSISAAAFDPGSSELWTRDFGAGEIDAVTADDGGNLYLAGGTTSADFGGGPLPTPLPGGTAFVASLDPNGKHRFSKALPFDTTQSTAVALTLDGAGNVSTTGSYVHHMSSGVIQSAFVVTLDPTGASTKSATFGPLDGYGTSVTQEGWGIAAGQGGVLYLGGDFYAAMDVAGTTLSGDGSSDLFVAKLAP